MRPKPGPANDPLPDYYLTVAHDMIAYCGSSPNRVWLDLGSGEASVGLALLKRLSNSAMVLVDPDVEALRRGVQRARENGVAGRVVAVVGEAERIPIPDESVDVVVSRGSVFFWRDRVQGFREVWRILRPGGRAMIGGGLGSRYPEWARREFIRRRRESASSDGPDAARCFAEARSSETFRSLAAEAGLPSFEVVGEGGLGPDDHIAGLGIWLRFVKEESGGG